MKKKKHKNKKHLKWGPNSPAQAVGSAIILNSGIDKVLLNIFLCRHRVQKEGDSQGREFLYFSPNSNRWSLCEWHESYCVCKLNTDTIVIFRIHWRWGPDKAKPRPLFQDYLHYFPKLPGLGLNAVLGVVGLVGGEVMCFNVNCEHAHQAGCRAHEERHGRCRLFWDVYPVTTAINLATFKLGYC